MCKYSTFKITNLLLLIVLATTGCIDRGSPLFKKIANQAGERETASTEKLIQSSPRLLRLDEICRSIPFFRDVAPTRKGISKDNDQLFYYYYLDSPSDTVYSAARGYFSANGWQFKKEVNGLWEYQIEFENDEYLIQISNGNFGESNYGTTCKEKRLSN